MKNNKGFGRFEVLTVTVILLGIFAFLGYQIVNGNINQKISAMKDSAISFSRTVTVNISSFHNTENVYLGEVVDEGLMKKIRSPFSSNYCSLSDSKVKLSEGMPYVTLKCDNYLIENTNFTSNQKISIYKVGDWSLEKKNGNDEEKVLYNCKDGDGEKYPDYYEELYFVSRVNNDFGTSHYFAGDVSNTCEVLSKTFYRTKKEVKNK